MSDQEQGNIPPKATPAAPGAPRPITVRLKPLSPTGAPADAAPTAEASADASATVKLSPVVLNTVAPPAPGAVPSPSATSSISQVQAAKSKTSRISLDSAIGVSTSIPIKPPESGAPKTIRLKRPSDLSAPMSPASPAMPPTAKSGTAPIRQTSRIPDSVLPADAGVDSSTVTQKKTLRIKRPGVEAAAEADSSMDGVQMMPISSFAPASSSSKGLTVTAIVLGSVAALLLIALTLCLASDALGPSSGTTAVADVPWPGKFLAQ